MNDSSKRPVLAYRVIFGAYGLWLPNDPRGSWSSFVASWELFRAGGPATKTTSRRSLAQTPHDVQSRQHVKEALKYQAVVFNGLQAPSIAHGFRRMVEKSGYGIYACSILPEHVHLVLRRHTYKVETMLHLLKAEASTQLAEDGRHPMARWPKEDGSRPSPWERGRWKVFLYTIEDIARAVRYVEQNPIKEGKPRQRWSFVTPYV